MGLPVEEIRVLHIEDDPAFADLASAWLAKVDDGIEIEAVPDGQAGLERLKETEFDCVVCDYDLPGLNGIEVLETVRDLDADLPFILFTGKGSEEVASDAISAGVTDYLRKSASPDQWEVLANRIRNAVKAQRAEERLGKRETALAKERTFIDQALDTLDDVFYVVNRDGTLRRWNSKLTDVSGYADEEIEEMHIRELFPEEHRDRALEAIEEVFETGEASLEAPLMTKDGEERMHEFSGSLFVGPDGETEGLVGVGRDITERKQREQELESFQRAVEQAADGIALLDGDEYVYVDESHVDMYGFEGKEDLLGRTWRELYDEEEVQRLEEEAFPVLAEDGHWRGEAVGTRPDGSRFPVELQLTIVEDGTLVCACRDMTERKKRERELRRQSRRFQATLEDPNILAGLLDTEGRLMQANQTALEYIEGGLGDVEGEFFWETPWWGEDEAQQEGVKELVERAAEGRYEDYEASLERPGGEVYHVEGTLRPVRDDEGEVVSIIVSARDVTERKRREEALREMNRRLEAVLETADVGIFIKDSQRRYQMINPRGREMFDLGPDEDVRGLTDEEMIPQPLLEQCRASDLAVLEEGEAVETEEVLETEHGQQAFLTLKSPMFDDDGEVRGICGVTTDITARKRREEELRLKTRAMDEAPLGIVLTDPTREGDPIVYVNDRFEELTGYAEDEVLGRNPRFLQGEDTEPEQVQRMREAIDEGEPVTVELRNYREDGTEFWNRVSIAPVRSPEGELTHFTGFQQDVTDRREAEEQLRRSERSLRELYEITSDGDRSFEEQIDALLRLGVERLDLPHAYVAEVDVDAGLQRIRASHGEAEHLQAGDTSPVSESYCRRTVEKGHLLAVEDASDEFAGDPADDRFDLGAYAGAPIRVDGDVWGTICFAGPEKRREAFKDTELVFVELVSQWIGYELERRRTEAELREKNDRLDRFASIVSHDLRNPLNVASGNLALAMDVEDLDSSRLDTVQQAHERMGEMIEEMLTLARTGEDVGEVDPVSLADVARAAWGNVETDGARLEIASDVRIDADESRLTQLMENLHRNAVEHGGCAPEVEVGPLGDGFYVEDDGPGIPKAKRAKVLESGYSTAEDGTGFGLSIVRQIASAHGWDLEITEGDEGGARFEFRIEDS